MKLKTKRMWWLLLLIFAALQTSCKDNEKSDTAAEMDSYVRNMAEPAQEDTVGKEEKGTKKEITELEICEITEYRASEQYSEIVLLNPTTDVIYVGSIIDGNSVADGRFRPLILDRAPLSISTDFENISGNGSAFVESPSLSSVRSAIKAMISDSQITGSTKATTSFEIKEVQSEEEVDVAIGASVSSAAVKVSSNFDFANQTQKGHYLVKFVQTYYTVDMDLPSSPSKIFAPTVSVSDIKGALNGSNTVPVYVSSVKYGRIAYFAIESSDSGKSFEESLNTEFKALCVSADVDADIKNSQTLKSCNISGTVIGGSGSDAVQAISGLDGFVNYIKNGGDYSKESPAAPVAFTLRRLSDNSVFNVVSGGEYSVRKCESKFGKLQLTPLYFEGVTDINDVYGTLTFQLRQDDNVSDVKYVINRVRNQFFTFSNGERKEGVFIDDAYYFEYDKTRDATLVIYADLRDKDNSGGDDIYSVKKRDGAIVGASNMPCKLSSISTSSLFTNDGSGNLVLFFDNLKTGSDYNAMKFVFNLSY